ncbi:MAG: hypothetical protein KGL39_07650 [Patescibacteria group bacterium]|nr:hypothetical protein [Patescibacteria group bacterium]
MFRLTVVFGPGPTTWGFLFKNREAASKAATGLDSGPIQDDFGQFANIKHQLVHGILLEDLASEGQIEIMLAQARSQARYQELIQKDEDPALKKAIQQQKAMRIMQGGGIPGNWPQA